jgi:hypothetical protein
MDMQLAPAYWRLLVLHTPGTAIDRLKRDIRTGDSVARHSARADAISATTSAPTSGPAPGGRSSPISA